MTPRRSSRHNVTGRRGWRAVLALVALLGAATLSPALPASAVAASTVKPVVATVSPSSTVIGAVLPRVTVVGTGFTGATSVAFGAVTGTSVAVVSDTQLQVTAPSRATAGVVDVRVTTSAGTSARVEGDQFRYQAPPAPVITAIDPPSAEVGSGPLRLTLTGTGFATATRVAVGTATGTDLTVLSDTSLQVTAPNRTSAGFVIVRVTTAGGTSDMTALTKVLYRPAARHVVTSVSPAHGPIGVATAVHVLGEHLADASAVWFGGQLGTGLTVLSPTELVVNTPALTTAGSVGVVVTAPGGTSAAATGAVFRFEAGAGPVVTGLDPTSGPMTGGTAVVVAGTHLTSATSVRFGAVPAIVVTALSDSALLVLTPAVPAAGVVDVTVTTPDGVSDPVATDRFTFTLGAPPAPVITGVGPGDGQVTVVWTPTLPGPTDMTPLGYAVDTAPAADGPWTRATTGLITGTVTRIDGLTNGTPVWFSVVAIGPLGAQSPRSASMEAMPFGPVHECGPITANTVWHSDVVHIVTCEVVVPAGLSLVIENQTVVRLAAGIDVAGKLLVSGQQGEEVTFTSYRDVPNRPAGDPAPAQGDWPGIHVHGALAHLDLAHVRLRYAGGVAGAGTDRAAVLTQGAARVVVTGNDVSDVASAGVLVRDMAPEAVLQVSDNTFERVGSPQLAPGAGDAMAWPVVINSGGISPSLLANNTGTGNRHNGTLLAGALGAGGRFDAAPGWVIGIGGGSWSSGTGTPIWTPASLDTGDGTVTFGPGTVVKAMGGRTLAHVSGGGTLVATGTVAQPVTFTRLTDDTVGGNTHAGDPEPGAPGDQPWSGITEGSVAFDHAVVAGAIQCLTAKADLIIEHSLIRECDVPLVSYASTPVVRNDRFESNGDRAIVKGGALQLADLVGNTGSGNGRPGTALAGVITGGGDWPGSDGGWPTIAGTGWTPGYYDLQVQSGVTVTVPAGGTIKSMGSFSVLGTLTAIGTAEAPVVVTSWRDDTVGGVTGDGTAPAPGDWGPLNVSTANTDTLTLHHADVRYAPVQVQNGTRVDIDSSTFEQSGQEGLAVALDNQAPAPVVTHNVFRNDQATRADPFYPAQVSGPTLDLSQLVGNSGSGNRYNGMGISGTLSVNAYWPHSPAGWANTMAGVTVPPGVRLTVPSGEVVKARDGELTILGSLWAVTGADMPGTFTSYADSTVGGDVMVGSRTPGRGDWAGIAASGSSAELVLSQDRVSFAHSVTAQDANVVSIAGCTITDMDHNGILVRGGLTAPFVGDNVVQRTGYQVSSHTGDLAENWAVVVHSDLLAPDYLLHNSGSGNSHDGTLLSGTITRAGRLAPVADWPYGIGGGYPSWYGNDGWAFYDYLRVAKGVTLTLDPGLVLKAMEGRYLQVDGLLAAPGTTQQPVTITSWRDDSVDGDTDHGQMEYPGDLLTAAGAGNWRGVVVVGTPGVGPGGPDSTDGRTQLDATTIRYAQTALEYSPGGGYVHGRIIDSTTGIHATDDSVVDATGVDWGSPTGPSPGGSGPGVSGAGVTYTPWVS